MGFSPQRRAFRVKPLEFSPRSPQSQQLLGRDSFSLRKRPMKVTVPSYIYGVRSTLQRLLELDRPFGRPRESYIFRHVRRLVCRRRRRRPYLNFRPLHLPLRLMRRLSICAGRRHRAAFVRFPRAQQLSLRTERCRQLQRSWLRRLPSVVRAAHMRLRILLLGGYRGYRVRTCQGRMLRRGVSRARPKPFFKAALASAQPYSRKKASGPGQQLWLRRQPSMAGLPGGLGRGVQLVPQWLRRCLRRRRRWRRQRRRPRPRRGNR